MTVVPESISSKRGKNRLKNKSNKLVTETLRLLDKLSAIAEETGDKQDIARALQAHLEILPFIRPKLQAISPAEMDETGGLSAIRTQRLAEVYLEAQRAQLEEMEQHLLVETNDDVTPYETNVTPHVTPEGKNVTPNKTSGS